MSPRAWMRRSTSCTNATCAGIGGADEPARLRGRSAPRWSGRAPLTRSAKALGCDARLGGGLRDLVAVLVGAGDEERLAPALPPEPHQGVRDHGGVRVAEVRLVVDVVDRRGEVEGLVRHPARRCTRSSSVASTRVAVVVAPHDHGLLEEVVADHLAVALHALHLRADVRQVALAARGRSGTRSACST